MINVLSLCDGISCGRIALEKAGFNVAKYFSSEIKKVAIKVTKDNYPSTIQIGDVLGDCWTVPIIEHILRFMHI